MQKSQKLDVLLTECENDMFPFHYWERLEYFLSRPLDAGFWMP